MTGGAGSFVVLGQANSQSYRPRESHPAHLVTSAAHGDVLLTADLLHRLVSAAAEASPSETGGLVAGRVLHDAHGAYTVLCGYTQAPVATAGPGHLELSTEETARLRELTLRTWPTADVVGWWHSHAGPSAFSGTDRRTQSMWENPQHVGLLVFASGHQSAVAYLGPDCAGCLPALRAAPAASHRPDEAGPSPNQPAAPEGRRRATVSRRQRAGAAAVGLTAAALIGTAGILAATADDDGRPLAPPRLAAAPADAPAEAAFSCRPRPDGHVCTLADSLAGDAGWYLDGRLAARGHTARLRTADLPSPTLLIVTLDAADGTTLTVGTARLAAASAATPPAAPPSPTPAPETGRASAVPGPSTGRPGPEATDRPEGNRP